MDIEKLFKRMIILHILILVMFIVLPYSAPYEINENDQVVLLVGLILMVIYFYNLYLLFNFKSLGKTLYIPLTFFTIFFTLLLPIQFTYQPNHFFYIGEILNSMVSGAIITFIYFTDIKSKFDV